MKRIWAILLSIAITLSLTVTAFALDVAASTPNMNMTVEQEGDTITIELTNSKKVEFDTMTFHIDFETTKLTCTAVDYELDGAALAAQRETSPYVGHSSLDNPKDQINTNGTVGFYYCKVDEENPGNGKGMSVDPGQLKATITFDKADGVEPGDTFTVTLVEDSNGEDGFNGLNDPRTAELTFDGAGRLLGDVDNDGAVTSRDAMYVAQYAAKLSVTINTAAADVDGDGAITSRDAMYIAQYAAKLISSFDFK